MRICVGIDPGLSGAVAWVWPNGEAVVYDTPTALVKNPGKYDYLASEMVRLMPAGDAQVAIETAAAFPGQSSSTTAKQFRGIGLWEGIAAGSGLSYELVTPRTWTHGLGLTRGASKGEHRLVAQRLFPELSASLVRVKDDGRADALLIAEWLRRRLSRV